LEKGDSSPQAPLYFCAIFQECCRLKKKKQSKKDKFYSAIHSDAQKWETPFEPIVIFIFLV